MKRKNKDGQIVMSAEEFDNLLWPAYRYCIGRRSYANGYVGDYWSIIRRNRDKLSEDRLRFLARDVRCYISEQMQWKDNIIIENSSNDRIVKDAYTLLIEYLIAHPDCDCKNMGFWIDCVACSVDAYEVVSTENTRLFFDPEEEHTFLRDYVAFANSLDSLHLCVCEGKGAKETCEAVQVPEYSGRCNRDTAEVAGAKWSFKWVCAHNWHVYPAPEYIKSVTPINHNPNGNE